MNRPSNGVLLWSIRRELWENRFIYLGPLVVTAVVLFGTFISITVMPQRMQGLEPAAQMARMERPFSIAPAPIMLASFLIGLFYSLDALYGERRDRSILFWKSMPVSDRTTVVSKASIPIVVLPLIAYVLSVASQIILLILSTPVLLAHQMNPARLWSEIHFFQGLVVMFYGLSVHALWFAPIYAWLMLISAWARRAPILWAVLPLLAVSALERMALGTSHFTRFLQYRAIGAMREAFSGLKATQGDVSAISQLALVNFLTTPGLWVGLAFAAACLAGAIRLRRDRDPI
ncbi:MAG: ABC transporter permease [Thermoanaerobaculia bacterium]